MAWHAGIVVVAAAGNSGAPGTIHSPGHDPYVITVGALDPNGPLSGSVDLVASNSSQGPTLAGLVKPDVITAGRKVVSLRVEGSYLDVMLPERVVDEVYFRLSGTSQATAVTSGIVTLLLDKNPNLRPDEVKYILKQTAISLPNHGQNVQGKGALDAYKVVTFSGKQKDNRGLRPANSFARNSFRGIDKSVPLTWKDLTFNGGVDSNNVTWDNVTWDNVTWDNVTWDNVYWDNVTWDNVYWDNVTWDNVTWDSAYWDSTEWNSGDID
jgi:serine protease AprX